MSNKQKLRALIVDDDPVLRIAVQQFITRLGFNTETAENGQAGVDRFREHGADIVLLDAAMPILDGFGACAAIRADENGAHVPIIMITVYEDERSVDHAFESGANEFITKPIHWAVLRNRVRQLVTAARAERQLRDDRAFFQSLVDSIPEPTLVCDRDGLVRWVNASVSADMPMTNATIDEPLSFAPDVETPDGDGEPPERIRERILAHMSESTGPLELLLHRKTDDRTEHFAELHVRSLRGGSGFTEGAILRFHDVTARELEGQRLRHEVSHYGKLAFHDSLTGLANRRAFDERLRAAVFDAARDGTQLAVMFLDLDGFKNINDTLGHDMGDRVLCIVSERLQEHLRHTDLVARLGGDEFALLLVDCQGAEVVRPLSERVLASLCEPLDIAPGEHRVSASIGIALFPTHAGSGSELTKRADEAMYAVKESGKNGARFWGES